MRMRVIIVQNFGKFYITSLLFFVVVDDWLFFFSVVVVMQCILLNQCHSFLVEFCTRHYAVFIFLGINCFCLERNWVFREIG